MCTIGKTGVRWGSFGRGVRVEPPVVGSKVPEKRVGMPRYVPMRSPESEPSQGNLSRCISV